VRVLVMPFENVKREGRIFWLAEASAVLLADDLNALGGNAIARQERLQAFERLQLPPTAILTDATVIRVGQLVGAAQVVVGSLLLENDTIVVRARSIALDTGRVVVDMTDRGPLPELFAIFERIARRMAPGPVTAAAGIEVQHPPIGVFEDFIKGVLAETPANAVNYLNRALAGQSSFDRARLALWDVYNEQSDHAQALAAVAPVRDDSPWVLRARFLRGLSQLHLKRLDDAYATFKALADAQTTPAALNNLGVVELRRGASPHAGQPAFYFKKAADADPDDADYVFNLGYAYWQEQDPTAAVYWLKEAVRLDPTDADAHFVLAAALDATGAGTEGGRERELARRLSAGYEEDETGPNATAVPKDLERIAQYLQRPEASRADSVLVATEQREQREMATFHLDRGRRFYEREEDRSALAELKRAIYLSPYQAEAHLLVGRIHLRSGRTREAIEALKISLWSEETAEGHEALGEAYLLEKNSAAARAEAERALALRPAYPAATELLKQAGPIAVHP
jgi:tetratricopeptide (TPR) repeat protein